MTLDDLWRFLTKTVFIEPSTPTLFNQYKDADPRLDKSGAVAIRRANLRNYLALFAARPPLLLVGEAAGPNGCRFSGIPFTSEHQLLSSALAFRGRQSSNRAKPYKESSATTMWGAIKGFELRVLVWNCVPFHPHARDMPLSIRAPTTTEIREYAAILRGLIDVLEPTQVVAIGRHAAHALSEIGIATTPVRHPSHGGATAFRAGVKRILAKLGRNRTPD